MNPEFDDKLFTLCRRDDYIGIRDEFNRRADAYPKLVEALRKAMDIILDERGWTQNELSTAEPNTARHDCAQFIALLKELEQ